MRLAISLLVFAWGLWAQPVRLVLDPDQTKVEYTLAATLHTVHGTFALKGGQVVYDLSTGAASGEIVIDATSGSSGNDARDRRMHEAVLESSKFSEIRFLPDRVETLASANEQASELRLHGQFWLHGAPHALVIDAKVQPQNGRMKVTSAFRVPYVDWGLKNPSKLFLRVADTVAIHIEADAENPS